MSLGMFLLILGIILFVVCIVGLLTCGKTFERQQNKLLEEIERER